MIIEPTVTKRPQSYSLKEPTIEMIKELADAYNTNASRIIEALVTNYGPKLIEQQQRRRAAEEAKS